MKGNILLLTSQINRPLSGGRAQLCKLNRDIIVELHPDRCTVFELQSQKLDDTNYVKKIFCGYIDGVSTESLSSAMQEIRRNDVRKVFVDGSNYGEFVRSIKSEFPEVCVYTFFHNVESKFFYDSLKHKWSLRALAVLVANYLSERKAVRYSDVIISLNSRDSAMLQRVYGRPATHISGMALPDKWKLPLDSSVPERRDDYILFVGGTFYANRAGIAWFVKYVSPKIGVKTVIVGKGFELYKEELEVGGRVEVVGEVDCLETWYRQALCVIAPIFDGSGMKTKVAEALMFGKSIIGTSEAFTGYEDIAEHAGRVCNTADEFVSAIEHSGDFVDSPFDANLRAIYEERYSYAAAKSRISNILIP